MEKSAKIKAAMEAYQAVEKPALEAYLAVEKRAKDD